MPPCACSMDDMKWQSNDPWIATQVLSDIRWLTLINDWFAANFRKEIILECHLEGIIIVRPAKCTAVRVATGDPFYTLEDLNLKAMFVIAHVCRSITAIILWIATNRHLTHVSIPWTILVLRWPLNFENETHRCGLSVWIPLYHPLFIWGSTKSPNPLELMTIHHLISSDGVSSFSCGFVWRITFGSTQQNVQALSN